MVPVGPTGIGQTVQQEIVEAAEDSGLVRRDLTGLRLFQKALKLHINAGGQGVFQKAAGGAARAVQLVLGVIAHGIEPDMLRSELCGSLAVCCIAVIDGKDEEKEQLQDIIAGKQVAAQSNVLLPAVKFFFSGQSYSCSVLFSLRRIVVQSSLDLVTEIRQAHFQMVLNVSIALGLAVTFGTGIPV